MDRYPVIKHEQVLTLLADVHLGAGLDVDDADGLRGDWTAAHCVGHAFEPYCSQQFLLEVTKYQVWAIEVLDISG